MRKNFLLIVFALLLLGGCKKDKDVHVAKVQAETPDVTTTAYTATINGTYSYASTLKSVVIVYGKDASLSSPQKVMAEHTRDSYSVTINNLDPGTTYYYYSIFDTGYGTSEGEQESFTTQNVALTVTTSSVSNITQTTATCGGSVASDGGSTVTARGVCWSTSPNPTVSNSHTTNGSGTGSFTSNITGLTANTTYYVRAYATNSAGTSYGEQKSFTTQSGTGGHEYVDLGLPSGTLWATCNVGADNPEDYGDYYAWGETETKSTYDWTTYKWGNFMNLTKYCTISGWGTVDDKTILDLEDDAAHVNWGSGWRMPTREEMYELKDNCTWTWTTQNGKKGYRVTGPNGKSIFLPAAGSYCYDGSSNSLQYVGSQGHYWSSSLATGGPDSAWGLYFESNYVGRAGKSRRDGCSVRPVYGSQSVYAPTVTTFIVSDITQTSATCGGRVESYGGAAVTACGVCWSTSPNPTVSNSHTTDNIGTGGATSQFTSNITGLTENTTYYVRAYATNSAGTSYGEQKSFTTQQDTGGHEYVDLGLPSGTLWATCNVGADNPEDYGWYFMWGSVTSGGDPDCIWANCPGNGGSSNYNSSTLATWDATHLTNDVLNPNVDVASVAWGSDWRMPTSAEWQELYNNTTCTWTTENGKYGCKFANKTDAAKYIFLPAAGIRSGTDVDDAGSVGFYWSSSLDSFYPDPNLAHYMYFYSGNVYPHGSSSRCFGLSVRPVR